MAGFAARQAILAWIAAILALGVRPTLGQEVAKIDIGLHAMRVDRLEWPKAARLDSSLQGFGAPVFNAISPDSPRSSSSLAIPERRGALEEMLQAHELSLGSLGLRTHQASDGDSVNGLGLDSVKLRVSRNKVLLRAQFSFN